MSVAEKLMVVIGGVVVVGGTVGITFTDIFCIGVTKGGAGDVWRDAGGAIAVVAKLYPKL